MAGITPGNLPDATLPLLGTDKTIVTRDGVVLNDVPLSALPLSTAETTALATKQGAGAFVALTDGATINTDVAALASNNFRVTLGGNRTLANPTNMVDGQEYFFEITQDATGGRTLAFGNAFSFSKGSTASINNTANSVSLVRTKYSATSGKLTASIIGDTGSTVSKSTKTFKTGGWQRWWGAQTHIAETTPNNNKYWVGKVEFASKFKALRFAIFQKSAMMESSGWRIAVAPTEVSLKDTVSNIFNAISGGTTHNVVASDTEPYAFREVKWNGGAKSGNILSSSQPGTALGYSNNADFVVCDRVEVGAVESTDAPGRYFAVLRIAMDASLNEAANEVTFATTNKLGTLYNTAPGVDAKLATFGTVSTNPVGSLTTIPTTSTWFSTAPYMAFYADYGIRTYSVWHVGDSITEDYIWPSVAVERRSSAAQPWVSFNLGGSTTRTESYLANMYALMQGLDEIPDYMLLPSVSINNYSPATNFKMPQAFFEFSRLSDNVNYLNSLGITPIIWTCYNYGVDTSLTTAIGWLHDNVRKLCASGAALLLEINGDPAFDRTIYNASTNPGGMVDPDATHPSSPTGINFFIAKYSALLATLGN